MMAAVFILGEVKNLSTFGVRPFASLRVTE